MKERFMEGVNMKNRKKTTMLMITAMAFSLTFSSCLIDLDWGEHEDYSESVTKTTRTDRKTEREEKEEKYSEEQQKSEKDKQFEEQKKSEEDISSDEEKKNAEKKAEDEQGGQPPQEQISSDQQKENSDSAKKEITGKAESVITVTTIANEDLQLTWKKADGEITFSVPEKYSCKWYVEGILQSLDLSNEFTLSTENLTAGIYNIMVIAEDGTFIYSAHANVSLE